MTWLSGVLVFMQCLFKHLRSTCTDGWLQQVSSRSYDVQTCRGVILTLMSTIQEPSSPISKYNKTDAERHFRKMGCFLGMPFDGGNCLSPWASGERVMTPNVTENIFIFTLKCFSVTHYGGPLSFDKFVNQLRTG